ncbi:PKD domain-containing protein [Streptomyces sp. MB09-01]|uniref:PKD domain-containing protein n=1 Tax=Streptomyces sp. MB09-01 TaxID=3028666 RepID=UPI0029B153C0|nr:PKD domain-containing protein [Streptomyces sp. MB09-01]MDX3533524.1 PKD domain-containing protein [Streptomyces sp. MB09-01]
MAQADPAKPDAHGATVPDLDLGKAKGSKSKGHAFSSPAERSVRKALPAGTAGAAAAPQVQSVAANPDLAVGVYAYGTTAHGVELNTFITSAPSTLEVTIAWGDGKTDVLSASGETELTTEHTYAEVGTYTVRVTVKDTANAVSAVNEVAFVTQGSDFTPYAPTRLLDTRDGTGAVKGKVAPYGSARVKVGGNGAIPAGVTAVVLNITVTNTTAAGHITAFAEGTTRPTTSNVNFKAGQTVPNLVIVPVGKNGYVELANRGSQSVDLIADVTGYFSSTESSGYTPVTPSRFVDTREGLGTVKGQLGGRKTFSTQIGGLRGVPQGITAVALNVTVTNPKEAGHLSVFPSGGATPTASNLNFTPGQTVANSVIVPVGTDGKISVFNGAWAGTDVVVDVVGFYSKDSKSAFVPLEPERLLDTRDPEQWAWGPLGARSYVYMPLSSGAPSITGFVMNSTVTNTNGDGFLTVTPDPNSLDDYFNGTEFWPTPPNSSNLNWTKGDTVPNLVQASTGANGIIDFWNQGWEDIDLVVDLFGLYEQG